MSNTTHVATQRAKRVLITGGTGTVGRALVESFSKADYEEVIFQHGPKSTAEAGHIAKGTGAIPWQCDLMDNLTLPPGNFSILVNCAGVLLTKGLVEGISDEEWHATMRINVYVPFALVRRYLPYMKATGWGRIINIGSIYSLCGSARNASYNVSKHALTGLTRSVAKEVAAKGVTINDLCPSAVQSSLMERLAQEAVDAGRADSGVEYFDAVRSAIPANRLALPSEIVAATLFLASDAAGFINGASIPIDGATIA